MMGLSALVRRNCKLFFKDKAMFFTSLITPAILLVLYVSFLGNIYKSSFSGAMPEGFTVDERLINATVGGQLISSILAVSCVTVAFCSNLLMVQDKASGAIRDLTMTPVRSHVMAIGYFISSAIVTLIICGVSLCLCLAYIAATGWYMSVSDILLVIADVILLVLFGTSLSSIVNFPMSTSGQGSAVGTIVSSGYGFICGAYMPISNFSTGLQRVLSFLPGTYGTSLLRNHALDGVYTEMKAQGFPAEVIEGIKDSIDCNLYFFDTKVDIWAMYIILGGSVAILTGVYVLMNVLKGAKKRT